MSRKTIAWYYVTGDGGYAVCSPDSMRYDHYFSTREQMRKFAEEMGWKLRAGK